MTRTPHQPNPLMQEIPLKTFDEAIDAAAGALEKAEKTAESRDPERARELVSVAREWLALADRLETHERD